MEEITQWLTSTFADIFGDLEPIDISGWGAALTDATGAIDPAILIAALAILAVGGLLTLALSRSSRAVQLTATLDRIGLLRVPPNSRDEIIHDALTDDLLSPEPSVGARAILGSTKEIGQAVTSADRKNISAALLNRIRNHGQIEYFPPAWILEKYFTDRRYFNNFYTPIIVSNDGPRTLYVSSLILIARALGSSKGIWAFTALVTVDPLKIMDQTTIQTDLSRASGQFIGGSVAPRSNLELHPWFIPIMDNARQTISSGSMPPGEYEMRITGYGSCGKRLFATNWARYSLTPELLVESFAGNDTLGNLIVEAHVADAIHDV